MNRANYFNYIEEKLNFLSFRIKQRGKINLLDLNIHSESFFAELCNMIFDLNFINANQLKQNIEGFDLIDEPNKVLAQITSICTKQKIEESLSKKVYKKYEGFNYKFISIVIDASNQLKNDQFANPYNLNFNPQIDILDPKSLLQTIKNKPIQKLKEIYELIRDELGQCEWEQLKVDTNLAIIVNILAEENLDINDNLPNVNEFGIEEKIKFNDLVGVRTIIDDYTIFCNKLDAIYSEFDKQGKNKSFSILQEIKKHYQKLKNQGLKSVDIFYTIAEELINVVLKSKNYVELPFEEIQVCIDIIVVDAFIRCKIFENPGGSNHVIT